MNSSQRAGFDPLFPVVGKLLNIANDCRRISAIGTCFGNLGKKRIGLW